MKKKVYREKYYGTSEELPEAPALTDTDEQTIADVLTDTPVLSDMTIQLPDVEPEIEKKHPGLLDRIFGGNN